MTSLSWLPDLTINNRYPLPSSYSDELKTYVNKEYGGEQICFWRLFLLLISLYSVGWWQSSLEDCWCNIPGVWLRLLLLTVEDNEDYWGPPQKVVGGYHFRGIPPAGFSALLPPHWIYYSIFMAEVPAGDWQPLAPPYNTQTLQPQFGLSVNSEICCDGGQHSSNYKGKALIKTIKPNKDFYNL